MHIRTSAYIKKKDSETYSLTYVGGFIPIVSNQCTSFNRVHNKTIATKTFSDTAALERQIFHSVSGVYIFHYTHLLEIVSLYSSMMKADAIGGFTPLYILKTFIAAASMTSCYRKIGNSHFLSSLKCLSVSKYNTSRERACII